MVKTKQVVPPDPPPVDPALDQARRAARSQLDDLLERRRVLDEAIHAAEAKLASVG